MSYLDLVVFSYKILAVTGNRLWFSYIMCLAGKYGIISWLFVVFDYTVMHQHQLIAAFGTRDLSQKLIWLYVCRYRRKSDTKYRLLL